MSLKKKKKYEEYRRHDIYVKLKSYKFKFSFNTVL